MCFQYAQRTVLPVRFFRIFYSDSEQKELILIQMEASYTLNNVMPLPFSWCGKTEARRRWRGKMASFLVLGPVLSVVLVITLGVYSLWYFFKAETLQSMTLDEMALTWKVHKREAGCTAACINRVIDKRGDVVGFECACGYVFHQKRRITQQLLK
jgi:hypothetical protein